MARRKRKSAALETARRRLAGLNSIDPEPNFGPQLTKVILKGKADALEARLAGYNQMLSEADTRRQWAVCSQNHLRQRVAVLGVTAQAVKDSSQG
jgi:hypothetical protein